MCIQFSASLFHTATESYHGGKAQRLSLCCAGRDPRSSPLPAFSSVTSACLLKAQAILRPAASSPHAFPLPCCSAHRAKATLLDTEEHGVMCRASQEAQPATAEPWLPTSPSCFPSTFLFFSFPCPLFSVSKPSWLCGLITRLPLPP